MYEASNIRWGIVLFFIGYWVPFASVSEAFKGISARDEAS